MCWQLCKFFKNEKHWGGVTFGVYTESGHSRAIAIAAFFLIRGYFIIHQVIFTPWGLQKYKNHFQNKKLCDQASDEIVFQNHQPPSTKSLPTRLGSASVPPGPTTGNCVRVSGPCRRPPATLHSVPRARPSWRCRAQFRYKINPVVRPIAIV